MNIHEKVERLTKELNEIKQQLEPEITEGQYWEMNGYSAIRRVNSITDDGLADTQNIETGFQRFISLVTLRKMGTLLSDKELEQALIKEAKRRGFDEGVRVDSDNLGFTVGEFEIEGIEGWEYDTLRDEFKLHDWCIYKQGEWAEIIEDEWEVEYAGGETTVQSYDRKLVMYPIGSMGRKEAETIKNALNNLDND